VGEKSGEAFEERGGPDPKIAPKGGGLSIANHDFGDSPEGVEARNDVFPDGGVEVMGVSKIFHGRPPVPAAKLGGPRCRIVRVNFSEELSKKS
jgi:hypothetical protein